MVLSSVVNVLDDGWMMAVLSEVTGRWNVMFKSEQPITVEEV